MDETPQKTCRNPNCFQRGMMLVGEIHPTGLCSVCCKTRGDLGCPECWDQNPDAGTEG